MIKPIVQGFTNENYRRSQQYKNDHIQALEITFSMTQTTNNRRINPLKPITQLLEELEQLEKERLELSQRTHKLIKELLEEQQPKPQA